MSNQIIKPFNVLEDDEHLSSAINVTYQPCEGFFSHDGKKWENLELSVNGGNSTNAYAIDGPFSWNVDECHVMFTQKLQISNPAYLFSSNNSHFKGVALPRDRIGVAALWHCNKSNIRGCERISDFSFEEVKKNDCLNICFEKYFPAATIGGKLTINYIIYLRRKGPDMKNGYAAIPGTNLGSLGSPCIIYIDGDQSEFPISIISYPGEPLWWVEYNIDDPLIDEFSSQYINIVLNEAHKDFWELGREKGYQTAFFTEIFSSAMEHIFIKIYSDFRSSMNDADTGSMQSGTIAYALEYMKQIMNIDTSSIEAIHETVRKGIYQKMQEGNR